MKKFLAYEKIKQDIKNGQQRQREALLEKAKNMSLAHNFVTDLTSLVVVLDGSPNQETYITGGSEEAEGMAVPIDGFNVSSLISPEDNIAAIGPCNITLFSAEYGMDDSLTFSASVPDLSDWGWEERLESLEVKGHCAWKIFNGKS